MITDKLLIDSSKSALNSIPSMFRNSFENAELFELAAQTNLKNDGNLYLFLSGFLIQQDKNQNCVRFLENGDLIFTEQILASTSINNNFITLSDCYFLKLPIAEIQNQVKQNPLYHLDILNVVTKQLQILDELSANKITLPLKFQLIKLVIFLNKQLIYNNYPIIPVGKKMIQNYLSCSNSNLNRLLTELEDQNLIQFLGKGFCVKNNKQLDKLLFS